MKCSPQLLIYIDLASKTNDKSEQNIKFSSLPPSIEGLKNHGKKSKDY